MWLTIVHGDPEPLAATRGLLLEMIGAGDTCRALASNVRIEWKAISQGDRLETTVTASAGPPD
jgi:hypothetical protein